MWIIYYSLNLAAFIPAKLSVMEGNVTGGEKRIIGFLIKTCSYNCNLEEGDVVTF